MYSRWLIQCILLLLVVVVKIDSQKRFRTEFEVPEEDDYLPSTPQGRRRPNECNCIPIRRCNSLRNRTDWRTVGETCFGYGDYRGVCCPETPNYIDGECGYSGDQSYPDSLVVNGDNAPEESWPWMVGLGRKYLSGYYLLRCSGFLIDRRHLISAAHCYNNMNLTARIGNGNQQKGVEYRIIRFLAHPNYDAGQVDNDIAILTLDREVNFPSFNPVCLPDKEVGRMDLDRRALTVVGWGVNTEGIIQINLKYWTGFNVQHTRELHGLDRRLCGVSSHAKSKDKLCASLPNGSHDICPISGSPLMVHMGNRWFAVGLQSFSLEYKCGSLSTAEGFTILTNYLDWIRENTKD